MPSSWFWLAFGNTAPYFPSNRGPLVTGSKVKAGVAWCVNTRVVDGVASLAERQRERETERAVPVCWSVTLLPYSCLTREFVSEKCCCSHLYFSARVRPEKPCCGRRRGRGGGERASERDAHRVVHTSPSCRRSGPAVPRAHWTVRWTTTTDWLQQLASFAWGKSVEGKENVCVFLPHRVLHIIGTCVSDRRLYLSHGLKRTVYNRIFLCGLDSGRWLLV